MKTNGLAVSAVVHGISFAVCLGLSYLIVSVANGGRDTRWWHLCAGCVVGYLIGQFAMSIYSTKEKT